MYTANFPSATNHLRRRLVLVLAAGLLSAAAQACDRSCLKGVLDHYLEAVFRHSPADAALADGHRATENARVLVNGDSVWASVTGYGSVGRRYVDVPGQQVAYFGLLEESTGPVLASVRIKVAAGQVLEAEWTVARAAYGGMFSVAGLEQDPPPAEVLLPAAQRTPRAQMLQAAGAYFEALQRHDGSAVPHIDGCERVENGVRVTHSRRPPTAAPGAAQEALSGDCVAGFEAFAHSIASTDLRRFPLVDEEAGVVMGTTLFHRPPGASLRRNLLTEYFHIRQGRIAAIYAAMFYLPPDAADSTGW